jgi:hypothetical protein
VFLDFTLTSSLSSDNGGVANGGVANGGGANGGGAKIGDGKAGGGGSKPSLARSSTASALSLLTYAFNSSDAPSSKAASNPTLLDAPEEILFDIAIIGLIALLNAFGSTEATSLLLSRSMVFLDVLSPDVAFFFCICFIDF